MDGWLEREGALDLLSDPGAANRWRAVSDQGDGEDPVRERKQRSLHCSPKEQDEIRARAKAAGKTVTRYVVDLVLADDPDRHPVVLTAGEQREQLEMLRHCDGVMRMLREELPGGSGSSLFQVLAVLEQRLGR